MQRRLGSVRVEVVEGNIVSQPDLDCVVNAANARLAPGGGVAGAIHRAAGPGLYEECRRLAPIRPGDAVITAGYGLPNRWVIHCLGPVYGRDHPETELLASCYRASIRLAVQHHLRSLGFPSISTGVFGYPMEEAAEIALSTVVAEVPEAGPLELIRFILFGREAAELHQRTLARLLPGDAS